MEIDVSNIIMHYKKRVPTKQELSNQDRLNILQEIVKPKKYIKFKDKQNYIKEIIKKNFKNINGKITYNTCDNYYEFICMLLHVYYDINITEDTFDKLSNENLLGSMLVLIGDEYNMFKTILDSYIEDLENGRLDLESL